MHCETRIITSGYDGKKCLVHARCCAAPGQMIATAQYLNVQGIDLFSGILSSTSRDGGRTWSKFCEEPGLAPIVEGDTVTVGCDATPMYHKKSGRVLLLGHTAEYRTGDMKPTDGKRYTFYSVYDRARGAFSKMKLLQMPAGYENCGNGSGQSIELENGELLIPVYHKKEGEKTYAATVLRCALENDELKLLEIGNTLAMDVKRGLCEPSLICYKGTYYMTLRNDECGLVAKSEDGLHYTDLQLWKWQDGALLQNYNTQQHWMQLGDELYLVYTRRGANNDHVFRHRAPLFAAKVEKMRLLRESEFPVVPQRGARLGNFCAAPLQNGKAMVMAAEWMQPLGCEQYGSDNAIFLSEIEP